MMNAEQLSRVGEKLVKRCGSRDPFEIARQLGINVMLCENFGSLKGMYRVIKRNRFIFLNNSLDENMLRIVCAHELGHDQLHRNMAKVGIQKATELCVWWFCTKHNVPVSLDPLKRTFVAVALLLLILPKELTGNGDFFRVGRRAQITRIVKTTGRRKGENDYNPFEVCSYD